MSVVICPVHVFAPFTLLKKNKQTCNTYLTLVICGAGLCSRIKDSSALKFKINNAQTSKNRAVKLLIDLKGSISFCDRFLHKHLEEMLIIYLLTL